MKSVMKFTNDRQLLTQMIVVLLVAALCGKFILERNSSRPTLHGKAQIEAEIVSLKTDIQELEKAPPAGSLEKYWLLMYGEAETFGLSLTAGDANTPSSYVGPLQTRSGVLSGNTEAVLAFLVWLEETLPIYITSITINGSSQTLVELAVVGV